MRTYPFVDIWMSRKLWQEVRVKIEYITSGNPLRDYTSCVIGLKYFDII